MAPFSSKCTSTCATRSKLTVRRYEPSYARKYSPLFVLVDDFCKEKNLSLLGMPAYIASGSHEHNGNKYRFLVMQKYGIDLGKLFAQYKKFPTATVFQIAIQIVSTLKKLISFKVYVTFKCLFLFKNRMFYSITSPDFCVDSSKV